MRSDARSNQLITLTRFFGEALPIKYRDLPSAAPNQAGACQLPGNIRDGLPLDTQPFGEQMLSGVSILRGEGLKVVRSHHERWDGRGYPDGLVGNEIPLAARVFAVADTLDAMTTNRPYRPAGRWDQAMQEIVAERGSQFDPDVVDALLDVEPKLRRVYYEFTAAGNVPDARSLARTEA